MGTAPRGFLPGVALVFALGLLGLEILPLGLTWPGDSGSSTDGRVFGKGYLRFVPAFWQRSGNGRRLGFGGCESVCLRFEP